MGPVIQYVQRAIRSQRSQAQGSCELVFLIGTNNIIGGNANTGDLHRFIYIKSMTHLGD